MHHHHRTPDVVRKTNTTSDAVLAKQFGSAVHLDELKSAPSRVKSAASSENETETKLNAALQSLEHVAEYLQHIMNREMVSLLPGLCNVLFEILEEVYNFGLCGRHTESRTPHSRSHSITRSDQTASNHQLPIENPILHSQREKATYGALLSLVRALDQLLIDFYGAQLSSSSSSGKAESKVSGVDHDDEEDDVLVTPTVRKRAKSPRRSVRVASALVIARHKDELKRLITDLVTLLKQPSHQRTSSTPAALKPGNTDRQIGGQRPVSTENMTPSSASASAPGRTSVGDDELNEQINLLSSKIRLLATSFGRLSSSEPAENDAGMTPKQAEQVSEQPRHQEDNHLNANTTTTRSAEGNGNGRHIVIEQIQVRKTETPEVEDEATAPNAENPADASTHESQTGASANVERQVCVEPKTVTESHERVEYDTVIGEDGRAYRRKRIIRTHVSTTHECEIIFSKKQQNLTPAMFLERERLESQLATKLPQAGVTARRRCVDQYIEILGTYREDSGTASGDQLSALIAKAKPTSASTSASASDSASFQSLWHKQEVEVVYSRPRNSSGGPVGATMVIDDSTVLPEEVAVLELVDADHLLLLRAEGDDGPYVRGGTVTALLVHACAHCPSPSISVTAPGRVVSVSADEYAQFQRVLLATYRTMVSSRKLCDMLIHRYLHLVRSSESAAVDNAATLAERTAKFLLTVVNELGSDLVAPADNQNSLVNTLCQFTTQLMQQYGKIQLASAIHSRVFETLSMLQQRKLNLPLLAVYATDTQARSATEQTVSAFLQFRSADIAQQLTLIDAELFSRIETKELLTWAQEQNEELCPNFTAFTEQFNNLSFWIRSLILKQLLQDLLSGSSRDRERLIVKVVKVMKHLRKLNNFNALIALSAALGSAPVRRLDWSRSIVESIDEFSQVIDSSSSFKNYRIALQHALQQIASVCNPSNPPAPHAVSSSTLAHGNSLTSVASSGSTGSDRPTHNANGGNNESSASGNQVTAVIPYIGVMLTDLTFIHQGNRSFVTSKDGEKKPIWQAPVNMWKRWQQFNSLDIFMRIRQMRYVGLNPDEKILCCFNAFRDFMNEEQQWAVFEKIRSIM